MDNIAIRIENVSKQYKLGVINTGTFFRDVQSFFARRTGKADPHAKLGKEFYDGPDTFWALKDITVDFEQGNRIAIIGKNGAGKSTLLKLISRITSPTEGLIKIKGRVISLLEVGTGFHKELTGRENIYLNGAILGMKRKQIDKIIDEIIDFSGIEKHIDTPVKRYSSGMFVRLGFAVAAHLDSEILIADEVLAVGDTKFQQKALGKMNEISSNQGRTVLFVSHNISAVQALCNQGIVLDKGKLMYEGNINDCINYYNASDIINKRKKWEGEQGDSNLKLYKAEVIELNNNSINLIIKYEIFNENLDYVFSIPIFNKYGKQLAYSSISDDCSENEYKKLINKGLHEITVTIDISLFSSGEYYIEFEFSIHKLKRIIDPDLKLFFEIFDVRNQRHRSDSRNNIIRLNNILLISS